MSYCFKMIITNLSAFNKFIVIVINSFYLYEYSFIFTNAVRVFLLLLKRIISFFYSLFQYTKWQIIPDFWCLISPPYPKFCFDLRREMEMSFKTAFLVLCKWLFFHKNFGALIKSFKSQQS